MRPDTATAPWPRAACVIGYPALHSRSPKLHGYWIAKYGLSAAYRAEEIPPDQIEAFITGLSERGYVGANVTMPHKDIAYALSEPDARARAVGAANTLWFEAGRLKSTNTDVEGFIGSIDAAAPGWRDRTQRAVVLGAGGAARAVVFGLIECGVGRIQLVNRTLARAEELSSRFGDVIEPCRWADLPGLLAGADLLVNATSLGMHGHDPLDVDVSALKRTAIVSDIVYVPLQTPLLAAAAARGLATANGLDMLLHQAVRGFELWFGIRPEVTQAQYELLARDIAASG